MFDLRVVSSVLRSVLYREMLEELMDDEDELREINLSSRPRREDRRRQRERNRLEMEVERAREIKEELEERALDDGQPITASLPPSLLTSSSSSRSPSAAANGASPPSGPIVAGNGLIGMPVYGPDGPGAPPMHAPGTQRLNGYGGGGSNGTGSYMPYSPNVGNLVVIRGPGGPIAPGSLGGAPPLPPVAGGAGVGAVAGYPVNDGMYAGEAAAGRREFLELYGSSITPTARQERLKVLRTKYDRERLRELRARFGWVREGREEVAAGSGGGGGGSNGGGGVGSSDLVSAEGRKDERERDRRKELIEEANFMR